MASSEIRSSVPLQISLYFHDLFVYLVFLLTIAGFIYKGELAAMSHSATGFFTRCVCTTQASTFHTLLGPWALKFRLQWRTSWWRRCACGS